jgi:anti-sigma regulatory factor (Ser/Thr protein kinase)
MRGKLDTILPSIVVSRERVFSAHPSQVREVRAFVSAVLGCCPARDNAVLCLSELANNAVLHSASRRPGGTFTVRIEVFENAVTIQVKDDGGDWAEQPPGDERGHGLDIVNELAADWGRGGSPLTGWLVWVRLEWS